MSDQKIKVAIIGVKGLPPFGGSARATESILNILEDQFEFTVYEVSTHSKHLTSLVKTRRIVFSGFKSKRLNTFFYYLRAYFHCLFLGNYDIIHIQHLYGGFLIPLLKLRFSVVTSARGIIPKDDNKWNYFDKMFFRLFEKISVVSSDVIVTVSRPHLAYLKKLKQNAKLIYIPNGITINGNSYQKDAGQNYILFAAARIIKLKGLHTLIEALNLNNYPGKVIIIGDLEQVKSYKAQIFNSADKLDIEFKGLIKDKDLLFQQISNAKLFIFPSFYEGLSNMLLEAASLNTPIIASGIIENTAVFNEDEVLFFKTGNANDLASKINWAINNEVLMKQKAEKAYQRVVSDYNWDKIALQYKELYNSLVARK
jgi:glycosyltransferase involved in cell wall biosynthesis